ncbi:hypothetical protein ACFXTO_011259 [Malus domestica]
MEGGGGGADQARMAYLRESDMGRRRLLSGRRVASVASVACNESLSWCALVITVLNSRANPSLSLFQN